MRVGASKTNTPPTGPQTTAPQSQARGGMREEARGSSYDEGAVMMSPSSASARNSPYKGNMLAGVEIHQRKGEAGESETLTLIGEVASSAYGSVQDGQCVTVELYDAANPGFSVAGTMRYHQDGLGAFMSNEIDTSDILPYYALGVRIKSAGGVQEFIINEGAQDAQPPGGAMAHPLSGLYIQNRGGEPGESEVLTLMGEPADAIYSMVPDGHQVELIARATDGASNPNYSVRGSMRYHIDGIGAFIGDIDTSDLIPYQRLEVEVRGELKGAPMSMVFTFDGESRQGAVG